MTAWFAYNMIAKGARETEERERKLWEREPVRVVPLEPTRGVTGQMAYLERWDVKTVRIQNGVREDQCLLTDLLDAGWEPFSANTLEYGTTFYHLRKFVYERVED